MCPGLQTETLWMQEEQFPLPPSLLLLHRALVAGGQAQVLGGSKPTGGVHRQGLLRHQWVSALESSGR